MFDIADIYCKLLKQHGEKVTIQVRMILPLKNRYIVHYGLMHDYADCYDHMIAIFNEAGITQCINAGEE